MTVAKKHTNTDDTQLPISIFAYGTLKRGFANHDRFCRNAIDIRPAAVWGRLYDLGPYPALEIPESAILARGTADPVADAVTQARFAPLPQTFTRPTGAPPSLQGFGETGWDLIEGELITLPDAARDLPPIDRLEGFRCDARSLFRRVLGCAASAAGVIPVWIYVGDDALKNSTVIRLRHSTSPGCSAMPGVPVSGKEASWRQVAWPQAARGSSAPGGLR